jgi:glutaredoxin
MIIKIYSKDKCPHCISAIEEAHKQASKDSSIEVIVLKLDDDFDATTMRIIFPEAKTYPQIIVDGIHVGGCKEFLEEIRISA